MIDSCIQYLESKLYDDRDRIIYMLYFSQGLYYERYHQLLFEDQFEKSENGLSPPTIVKHIDSSITIIIDGIQQLHILDEIVSKIGWMSIHELKDHCERSIPYSITKPGELIHNDLFREHFPSTPFEYKLCYNINVSLEPIHYNLCNRETNQYDDELRQLPD